MYVWWNTSYCRYQIQASIRVARESWGLLSSHCRKKETSSRLVWFHSLCHFHTSRPGSSTEMLSNPSVYLLLSLDPLHLSCHSPCRISCLAWLAWGLQTLLFQLLCSAFLSLVPSGPVTLWHSPLLTWPLSHRWGLWEVLYWPRSGRLHQML